MIDYCVSRPIVSLARSVYRTHEKNMKNEQIQLAGSSFPANPRGTKAVLATAAEWVAGRAELLLHPCRRIANSPMPAFIGSLKQGFRERVWPFARNNHSTTPILEAEDWSCRLREEKDSLFSLVDGMETEFIHISEGLESVGRELDEIQLQSRSLVRLSQGHERDAAVRFAFELLDKAEHFALATHEQYSQVCATFAELRQRLSHLPKQHDELMRALLPLNPITTAFRIEASHHSPETRELFFTLADDVARMVNEVRCALERQFEELAVGERIAQSLMEQVSESIQQHQKELDARLEVSRSHLSALSQALSSSGAVAMDLSNLNEAIMRHMSGIIMALQCQDITRQKIQRLGNDMDEMRAHLDEARATAPASMAQARQWGLRGGQRQLQQVQNVFDELTEAADSIKSGIERLRSDAGAAAQAALKVGAAAFDARLANRCETSIDEISAIIAQTVQNNADIIAAFEPLQASFVDCTSKATKLAGGVRYAAVNAQVFAVHVSGGATLEVLAQQMRATADETIQQAERLSGTFQHTSGLVKNLRRLLADFQQSGHDQQTGLAHESVVARKTLSDLECAIPVLIQRVTQRQASFAQSIEKVLASVQFPVAVNAARSQSIGFFQDWVARVGEVAPELVVESEESRDIDMLKPDRASGEPANDPRETTGVVVGECLEPGQPSNFKRVAADQSLGENVEMF